MTMLALNMKPLLYLAVTASYLSWSISGSFSLMLVFAGLLFFLVVQAVPGSSRKTLVVSIILAVLGSACLFFTKASPLEWLTAFSNNGGLVSLFIVLPLYSFILAYEDYRPAITQFFNKYIHTGNSFCVLVTWLSYILGAIMNLAALQLLYGLLKKNADAYNVNDNFNKALTRGNITAIFWAPNYMSVATVLTYTGLSWLAIAPLGFLISCLLTFVATLSFLFPLAGRRAVKREISANLEINPDKTKMNWGSLIHLLFIYIGLIATVAAFNYFTTLKVLPVISLMGILFPLLLALVLGKLPIYRAEFHKYYYEKLPRIKNEVLLFSSVGFFGKALDVTGVGAWITQSLHLSQIPLPGLAVFVIISLEAVLSLIGVHPIVTISALASALGAADFGLSNLAYAYALLLGYGVGVIISPFSAITLVMSGVSGEKPWAIVRQNISYALMITVLFSLLLPLIK